MKAKAALKSAKTKLLAMPLRAASIGPARSAASASSRSLSVSIATALPPSRRGALYAPRAWGAGQTYAPDAAAIERLAEAAIARLPEAFRRHLTNVVLRIEDFADDEVLDAARIEDPFELSGLYQRPAR